MGFNLISMVLEIVGCFRGERDQLRSADFIQIIKHGLDLSGSEHEEPLTRTVPSFSKVVYKGFIKLSARKAINFGVGPKPIATREHRVW